MDENGTQTPRLRDILRPLRRNWRIVLLSFLSVVLTVGYLTLKSERVYEASATLSIRDVGEQGQPNESPNIYLLRYLINNQVVILESRSLATEVAKRLLESVYKDTLRIMGKKENREAEQTPYYVALQRTVNRFMNTTRVVQGRDTDIVELKARASNPGEAALLVNLWVEAYQNFKRSDSHEQIVQTKEFLKTKLKEVDESLEASEDRLARYQRQNKVVSLSDETSQIVRTMAHFESMRDETKTEFESVQNQLSYLKNQLDESKKTLVEDMTKLSNPVLQELQSQMAELMADKAAYEAQLVGAGLKIPGDTKLSQMENRIKGIQEKIVEETKKLVKDDMRHINPLDYSENLITRILELETQQNALNAKMNELETILEKYAGDMKNLPNKSRELARLERDVQVNTNLYVMLRERFEETKIKEAGQVGIARIVDLAVPPTKPVSPKVRLNMLLGCFFGLMLGMGLAFMREYFADTIHDEEDLKKLGLQVIGEVPPCDNRRRKLFHTRYERKNKSLIRAKEIYPYLLTRMNGHTTIAEAYRAIRTSVYLFHKKRGVVTLLLTSPGPSEGKSTTAANLAITMAKKGVKTLLVDSDLRKPVLDILFMGSGRKTGLTNYLGRGVDWHKIIRETTVQGLHLMAAGTGVKNASEILGSKSMESFIEESGNEYGMVIFDSPPLLPVTDATILASVVDGVVLVAGVGKTSKESVKRAMELLENAEANVLGVVVTGMPIADMYGYREYYGI